MKLRLNSFHMLFFYFLIIQFSRLSLQRVHRFSLIFKTFLIKFSHLSTFCWHRTDIFIIITTIVFSYRYIHSDTLWSIKYINSTWWIRAWARALVSFYRAILILHHLALAEWQRDNNVIIHICIIGQHEHE